jgi:GntR family transcriptional repressor for pyruvate dehydrogenase complex
MALVTPFLPIIKPMPDVSSKSTQLPDEIAGKIKQLIQARGLNTGDRLPSERDLCEQFAVSRPVVREALSRLKSSGLVDIRRGIGVFVSVRDPREAFRVDDVDVEEKILMTQIMELISTVEVAATRLAALRRTPEDLKQIKKCLIGMEYAIASDQLGDEEDYQFHQSIVLATHNPYFEMLSQHLEHTARRMIRRLRSNTKTRHTALIEAVQAEHQAIYNAIAAGDAVAAEHAASTHLQNATKRFTKYLKQ